MNWSIEFLIVFVLINSVYSRPGIRSPPERLLRNFENESILDETTSTTTETPNPLIANGRIFPNTRGNKFGEKINQTIIKDNNNDIHMELVGQTSHMGVAVPVMPEDIEKEINEPPTKLPNSSTSKEGISTWILLSGANPTKEPQQHTTTTTTTPTTTKQTPTIKSTFRYEAKIEKLDRIEKFDENDPKNLNKRTTIKPKQKLTTTKIPLNNDTSNTNNNNNNPIRRKKPINESPRPVLITKKPKKPTTTVMPTIKMMVTKTTTQAPTTSQEMLIESSSASPIETTTFLIMEPKDADFDLPQDRSPGSTTKKPKRNNKNNKTKKNNKNKDIAEKKPASKNPPQKDNKPLTTKIYNYLAREVMPTVGVGLVGLAVTAGLATYFLGPFGALRRSYDVADRKDDMYFYNNEEYAGADGQSEEEVFGKVIAGMPSNSPYRNNIKYTIYRPNQVQQTRPIRYDPKYSVPPPQPPQYRYRNNGPVYQGQQPPGPPHPMFNQQKQESYQQQQQQQQQHQQQQQQQYFRYNNDLSMYRTNAQNVPISTEKRIENDEQPKQTDIVDNSSQFMDKSDVSDDELIHQSEQEQSIDDNNVLRRRSQFVVGSVQSSDTQDDPNDNESTIDSVPEHGPRKRRDTNLDSENDINNEINDMDNEIDGIVHVKIESIKTTTEKSLTMKSDIAEMTTMVTTPKPKEEEITNIDGEDIIPTSPMSPTETLYGLIRSLFEIKVRMGLNFLQNTTTAFQRYLKGVEQRVNDSKLFSKMN